MITKNQIKYIRSLSLKKNRIKEQCFVVEGEKMVNELLGSNFTIVDLFATKNWMSINEYSNVNEVSEEELLKISNLKSANSVLAIVKIINHHNEKLEGITLILDELNDPGNLGTIIRICDWFNIKQIVCSENTVDLYNPKVVQSSMGSIFRVNVIYTSLIEYLSKTTTPIYGAYIKGKDIKEITIHKNACLVLGNEANGISKEISTIIQNKVSIKNLGGSAESLNVAVAASILLYEFTN